MKIDTKKEEVPASTFEIDPLADEAAFEFVFPVGGKKADEKIFIAVKSKLSFEVGGLEEKGEWRSGGEIAMPEAPADEGGGKEGDGTTEEPGEKKDDGGDKDDGEKKPSDDDKPRGEDKPADEPKKPDDDGE